VHKFVDKMIMNHRPRPSGWFNTHDAKFAHIIVHMNHHSITFVDKWVMHIIQKL